MNNIVYIIDKEQELGINTWNTWCSKNQVSLVEELPENLESIDKIAIVSSHVFIRWDCPNFFNLVDSIGVVRETDDFGKIYEKIKDTELFSGDYVNTDFVVLSKENFDLIDYLMDGYKREETFNLAIKDRAIDYLPTAYNTTDILRKDMLSHNWQLGDKYTFLFKYAYVWNLKSLDKDLIERLYAAVSTQYTDERLPR